MRGAGSAAFVIGTLIAGQVISVTGLASAVLLHSGLLLAAALATSLSIKDGPEPEGVAEPTTIAAADHRALLHLPLFRRLLLVAALVLGSHAMHDAFAVIPWNAAGIGPGQRSLVPLGRVGGRRLLAARGRGCWPVRGRREPRPSPRQRASFVGS